MGKRAFFALPPWRRLLLVAAATAATCRFILTPSFVSGESMEPTYGRRGVNAVFRLRYLLHPPRRGDVVAMRYHGRAFLLKRVLAFAGETVEFRDGRCIVDGVPLDEPYVKFPCDWELPPRLVAPGRIYVMGDNRSMPAEAHVGGEISLSRLAGAPLF